MLVILVGTILLSLPISNVGGRVDVLTALFTATTSVCVTGLVVVDTFAYWTLFGKVVILILIQIGGMGIIAIICGMMLMLHKKVNLKERMIIQDAYNLNNLQGVIKFVKKIFIKDWIIKFCNYINLTIISSIALVGIGIFYFYQFQAGNIFWGDEVSSRLYTLLDYSNLFRFYTTVTLVTMFFKYPNLLITGITENQYTSLGVQIFWVSNVPYHYLVPHNLFFSHLKMYGIFSIVETIYLHFILRKIVNKENFLLYIAIFLYSIILGAGLYSYWLYLTFFMLVLNEDSKEERKMLNANN